jgi:hypothetical protein
VVPDVVADHDATLHRFAAYRPLVVAARFPVAFVAQDGCTPDSAPWDLMDCLFIGGSTEWKMSPRAFAVADEARQRGKWVHVGRVNSWSRFESWSDRADSCDGTFLAFGPAVNAPRVASWMDRTFAHPRLELT